MPAAREVDVGLHLAQRCATGSHQLLLERGGATAEQSLGSLEVPPGDRDGSEVEVEDPAEPQRGQGGPGEREQAFGLVVVAQEALDASLGLQDLGGDPLQGQCVLPFAGELPAEDAEQLPAQGTQNGTAGRRAVDEPGLDARVGAAEHRQGAVEVTEPLVDVGQLHVRQDGGQVVALGREGRPGCVQTEEGVLEAAVRGCLHGPLAVHQGRGSGPQQLGGERIRLGAQAASGRPVAARLQVVGVDGELLHERLRELRHHEAAGPLPLIVGDSRHQFAGDREVPLVCGVRGLQALHEEAGQRGVGLGLQRIQPQ